MKRTDLYDKLLQFMYDEYDRKQGFHGYGERVRVLIARFERLSAKNRIGNANAKSGAIRYLHENGWIDIRDTNGNKLSGLAAFSYGRMQPTPKGREYLEQRRTRGVMKVAGNIVELCGRLAKGLHGR
jgi:hypothetical protein